MQYVIIVELMDMVQGCDILTQPKQARLKKRTLFNKIKQYNIQIVDNKFFFQI